MTNFKLLETSSSFLMIFCGLSSCISYHKHLLNSLLSLEFMMLLIFWLLSLHMSNEGSEFFFFFFYTLTVCEGALGLALLVLIVRSHGNDYFKSFNVFLMLKLLLPMILLMKFSSNWSVVVWFGFNEVFNSYKLFS